MYCHYIHVHVGWCIGKSRDLLVSFIQSVRFYIQCTFSKEVMPSDCFVLQLNLSHNLIQVLEVSFLCIPTLEKLNLAHNAISKIIDGKKVRVQIRTPLN